MKLKEKNLNEEKGIPVLKTGNNVSKELPTENEANEEVKKPVIVTSFILKYGWPISPGASRV